jgi:long-chain acyl-CoA synthetase
VSEQQIFDDWYASLQINHKLIHVGLLLERAARMWPERTAVICDDQSITYQELYRRALLCADLLRTVGVKPDNRVLIWYENSLDFFIAYFAIWQVGAVVAPLNIFLQEAEFEHILHDAQPAAIIISDARRAALRTVTLSAIPVISSVDIAQTADSNITSLNFTTPERDLDQLAALLYTSGTTGFPKGVMLSSRNIVTNALQAIARINGTSDHKVYCALPLFHSLPQNTCVWSNTILGSTAIIISKIERRLLLQGFAHNPDIIVAVPALYGLFALMKNLPLERVSYFVAGGDALSNKIRMAFELVYRRKICNGYGLTETTPFIAVDLDDYTQPTSCVGKPFVGISCEIRDDAGRVLPAGEIGTLWVSGDNIMLGYYKAPEATAHVLQDGWLQTGDLAYINHDHKIVLVGRERDLIIQKGVKIYPQEVENTLLSHTEVMQAAVIGVQSGDGEIPVAFIGSRTDHPDVLKQELKEFCMQKLSFYKVPREIIILRELPATSTGKVDKKKLKAEYNK